MYDLIDSQPAFFVISKHPGVDFHKGAGPEGLVARVRADLNSPDLFPVHRLDTMTSGLLLFARSRDAAREIAGLFRNRVVEKFYLALGDAHPKKKQGMIKGDMVRGRRGVWILARTCARPAITQFFSAGMGNGLRLYLLRPRTGRTHQIRVAMKSLGAPVLGDPLYAGRHYAAFEPVDRGYLHAYALRFTLGGREYCYKDVPRSGHHFTTDSFSTSLEKFDNPWALPWPGFGKERDIL